MRELAVTHARKTPDGAFAEPAEVEQATVPVLIRHRAPMTQAQYDEAAPALITLLKQQPGFVVHVAYEDASGFVVARGAARRRSSDDTSRFDLPT